MDLDSLKDPHILHNYSSSPLNNNSNTSDTKVTKLNESSVVNVEQKQIKHFKIGDNNDIELSKQQVPVKQMIATTSVGNTPKLVKINVHPHCIDSSLDISNSTSGTKITKLNESFSTKPQEQNKTENFKIGDKHDVEISKQQKPVNQIIADTSVINENNIYPTLNNSSSTTGKEVTKLNESSVVNVEQKQIKHFKIGDNNDIELSKQQVPVKQMIATTSVGNTPKLVKINVHPYCIDSSLDISNSTSGTKITKLNESFSTKPQEQNKTENFKIGDKHDGEISKQQKPVNQIIADTSVINENNIYPTLNNSSSTTGKEVTKLNESSVVNVEQKQIKHFKIGDNNDIELSKQQVPVKQMIATTSVGNTPKLVKINVHPHCIDSSLDISNSTSGTKITKLNESFSTKPQEQNKTENFKIGDKHDGEISKQQKPVNQIIADTSVINENNIYPTLNNSSSTTGKEVTKLNESSVVNVEQKQIKHFKIGDNNDIELSKQQVPVKQMIATTSVGNTPKLVKINVHPHCIDSSLDISNSTSGTKITKLNESFSTKPQEQNKTENFKIGDKHDVEISKQQKPVNQIIADTSVINENNIYPTLNNSSSTTGKEVTTLNESALTKVQEKKNTEHQQKVNRNNVEISNSQIPVKRMIPISVVNSPTMNVSNIRFRNSNCDVSSLLNNSNKKHSIEITPLNQSTSTKVHEQKKSVNLKIVDKIDADKYQPHEVPVKKIIKTTFVLNNPQKNQNNLIIRPNNFPFNLEKIAVPKTVLSNVKILPTIMPGQIKKPISIIPSTTHINPKNSIITRIQPKLNPVDIINNKGISTLNPPRFKIISSNDLKSKMVLVPPKQGKYVLTNIENGKVTNLRSFIPTSPMLKPLNSIIPVTVVEKFNTIEKSIITIEKPKEKPINTIEKPNEKPINAIIKPNEKIIDTMEIKSNEKTIDTIEIPKIKNIESKFVIRFKEFENQRYKISPVRKNMNLKNSNKLFESNSYFKLIQQSSKNSFIKKLNRKRKPHIGLSNSKVVKIGENTTEFKHNQQAKELSSNENKNLSDFYNVSEPKKHIPHTITSKDLINNHSNVVIISDQTDESKINTNVKKELCPIPGFIQLARKPDSLIKTYGQPLPVTKYGNFNTKEQKTVRLVPISSFNQPKTILNTNIPGDGKHLFVKILKKADFNASGTIAKIPCDNMLKIIPNTVYTPKNLNINTDDGKKICYKKISFVDPIRNSNNSTIQRLPSKQTTVKMIMPRHKSTGMHGPFIRCEYEYCDTIAYKPEMIDKMYCSPGCKNLDTKLKLATKKPAHEPQKPQENTNILKRPMIDRKMLLAKLRSRINKRKQSLPPLQKENVLVYDLDKAEKLDDVSLKMPPPAIPLTVKSSFQKSQSKRKFSKSSGFTNSKQETANVMSYLQHTDYIPAPKKLFDNPFPYDINPFKVGQRLEGIDPEHEALFCVMSVVEVCGYRIKLHFDGYSDLYDFWVNANCPDLFYPRWCEENFHTLQPPRNYNRPFKWTEYLKLPGISPAPKWNFPTALNTNRIENHSFYIGAKLEALDKLTRTTSKQLICVATIADILGSRIRIHFDGWTDDFDYWTDITSTNIHPVGWCDKNGRTLCAPKGYDDCKGKQPFSWTKYLSETNSEPVPEDAFFRRPLREFTNSMAIEVVDIANPSLIRIAKVVDVKGDELKILYDGFDTIYAYWIEDDSPNIHPLGWCLSTNHPIELFKADAILWSCRVPGCNGKGNIHSTKNTHIFAKECPYEFESWKKLISGVTTKPDRIRPEDCLLSSVPSCLNLQSTVVPTKVKNKKRSKFNKMKAYNFTNPRKRTNNSSNLSKAIRARTVYKRAVEVMDELEIIRGYNDYTSYGYGSFKRPRLNAWTRHSVLHGIPIFTTTDVRKWPVKEVATFVEIVVSDNYTDDDDPSVRMKISKSFMKQEIDGDVFLMLTQKDLTDILNIPLGPALKLHNAIVVLRQRISAFDVADGSS